MNIEEFENEIEKILDENHEQKMRWMELYIKAHKDGNKALADTFWKEVEYSEARDKGVFQAVKVIEKMLNSK